LVKGMPSAVVLSILIHAGLFLMAGMLVVFTVVKKDEQKFDPPKVIERPKMKLKKPKVKVKKTSKPKPTTRIVTKMNRANMPDIQLPEMSGLGGGFGVDLGGFDMMPDLDEVTLFGSGQSIGNDFVGTFYDFKRDYKGRDIPHSIDKYLQVLKEFIKSGWKITKLSRYYHSPNKLYATTFTIPPILSLAAPEAFGEPDTIGYLWMAHYKGQLVHQEDITFRFWGMGDDIMVVRVDGEVVLNASWPDWYGQDMAVATTPQWRSRSPDTRKYFMGNNRSVVGDWITLKAGVSQDMEIIFGEVPGGGFCTMLAVEVEGVEYERGPQSNPILPIFKTSEPSLDLIETIHADLVPGEVCVTNGPVFSDYETAAKAIVPPPAKPSPGVEVVVEEKTRSWTSTDGKTLKAEFITVISGKAVLRDARGKQRKIPLSQLSEEDRLHIELVQPPKFNIGFSKQSSQRFFKESPILPGWMPEHLDYVFSAKLKQTSAGEYNHELHVEFFAIGEEIDGDNYILFDRQESNFTPTKENGRSHMFRGDPVPVRVMDFQYLIYRRGQKYGGYLIVVTDERGKIIDHGASHKWLLGIVDPLRVLPEGKHFDKTGARVEPPRPKSHLY